MMIPPAVGNPYSAAAALDRQLRSSGNGSDDASSDGAAPDAGPDVVVTLSRGASSSSTYDASGKVSRSPTLDEMGANAPDSLAHATESVGDDDDDASTTTSATSATDDADANVDEDAAVPA